MANMFAVLAEPDSPVSYGYCVKCEYYCDRPEHFEAPSCKSDAPFTKKNALPEMDDLPGFTPVLSLKKAKRMKQAQAKAAAAHKQAIIKLARELGAVDGKLLIDNYGKALQDAFEDALFCPDRYATDYLAEWFVVWHLQSYNRVKKMIKDKTTDVALFYEHYVPALRDAFMNKEGVHIWYLPTLDLLYEIIELSFQVYIGYHAITTEQTSKVKAWEDRWFELLQ